MEPSISTLYEAALDAYLAALDRVLPDVVEGVYLTGSTALGDYQPGRSDLDILTLTARPLTEAELNSLDLLHRGLEDGGQPHLDAHYLPRPGWSDGSPDADGAGEAKGRAHVVHGEFKLGPSDQDIVIWAIMAQCGIAVRGPAAAEVGNAPDPAAFRAWNLGNLESYWRGLARQVEKAVAERDPDSPVDPEIAVWIATGPGRLHRTIATGEIISKTESADYGARLFPEHAEILGRAKASRLGDGSALFTARDGRALARFVHEVCDAAAKL